MQTSKTLVDSEIQDAVVYDSETNDAAHLRNDEVIQLLSALSRDIRALREEFATLRQELAASTEFPVSIKYVEKRDNNQPRKKRYRKRRFFPLRS